MFGLAVWKNDVDLDLARTSENVCRYGQVYNELMVEEYLSDVLTVANLKFETWVSVDYNYLFPLCRRLYRHLDVTERKEAWHLFAPLGLVLIEVLDHLGKLGAEAGFRDRDETMIAFEATWRNVKFAEGEDLLAIVMERAKSEPVVNLLGRLGLMVNFAYHLQIASGDSPIFLTVGDEFAKLFNTSPKTISDLVKLCHARGYLIPKGGYVPHKRSRTWKFNFKHADLTKVKTVSE